MSKLDEIRDVFNGEIPDRMEEIIERMHHVVGVCEAELSRDDLTPKQRVAAFVTRNIAVVPMTIPDVPSLTKTGDLIIAMAECQDEITALWRKCGMLPKLN